MLSTAPDSLVLDPFVMAAIRSLGDPGEPDMFAEVTELFLADAPGHLSALRAAIVAKKVDVVFQVAHRLRGSALEMGAIRMAPVCAAIEHAARDGSLEHADTLIESLDREFEATRLALQQAIAS